MNPIKFYKNGILLYELHKIGNLYVLNDIRTNESKSFRDILTSWKTCFPKESIKSSMR